MDSGSNVSRFLIFGLCLAATAGLSARADAPAIAPPDVPDNIRAPADQKVVWSAHATGAQIYLCQTGSDGKPQWTLKAPQAELRDDKGVLVGQHYTGPTWKHQDGSEVTGKAVARADSPDAGSIPWLLVTAVAHRGDGVLSRVTSIQRIHTKGGQPPASPCDASKSGTEVKIPYTADYYFYAS